MAQSMAVISPTPIVLHAARKRKLNARLEKRCPGYPANTGDTIMRYFISGEQRGEHDRWGGARRLQHRVRHARDRHGSPARDVLLPDRN